MSASSGIVVAAIDIGSSAIRMDVAEIRSDGSLRVLDAVKKGVQLGTDAFTQGRLSEGGVRAACDALRDFKKVMATYGVVRYRAVATSAVRESNNSETFLDRVLMSTGLEVEVIDGPEETRLTYSAVLESLRAGPELQEGKSLLVEVGGGSTDVTLMSGGELLQSSTFPLGPIRLRSALRIAPAKQDQRLRLMKRQINNILANVRRSITMQEAVNYIAVGGDVRFAATTLTGTIQNGRPPVIPSRSFSDFADSTARLSVDTLVQRYSISYADAETLGPALLIYLQLLRETQAKSVIVSKASIRAGILQDLAAAEKGEPITRLNRQILSAARSLGRKYQFDEQHAERVRELSLLLFDELKAEHRLSGAHGLYLQVAALLHDIGLFINPRSHHKHSYYLISQSEIFGLRSRDLEVIANIARYHRKSMPQRSHLPYLALDRDERVVVSKLAAILRVANILDKEHLPKTTDLKVVREGDQIVLIARNVSDLALERSSLETRSDFFTQVFGQKLVLREASKD